MVGAAGFEPTAPTPPAWCATRLRYAPIALNYSILGLKIKFFPKLKKEEDNLGNTNYSFYSAQKTSNKEDTKMPSLFSKAVFLVGILGTLNTGAMENREERSDGPMVGTLCLRVGQGLLRNAEGQKKNKKEICAVLLELSKQLDISPENRRGALTEVRTHGSSKQRRSAERFLNQWEQWSVTARDTGADLWALLKTLTTDKNALRHQKLEAAAKLLETAPSGWQVDLLFAPFSQIIKDICDQGMKEEAAKKSIKTLTYVDGSLEVLQYTSDKAEALQAAQVFLSQLNFFEESKKPWIIKTLRSISITPNSSPKEAATTFSAHAITHLQSLFLPKETEETFGNTLQQFSTHLETCYENHLRPALEEAILRDQCNERLEMGDDLFKASSPEAAFQVWLEVLKDEEIPLFYRLDAADRLLLSDKNYKDQALEILRSIAEDPHSRHRRRAADMIWDAGAPEQRSNSKIRVFWDKEA